MQTVRIVRLAAFAMVLIAGAPDALAICGSNRPNCGPCWVSYCSRENLWECRVASSGTACSAIPQCYSAGQCNGSGTCVPTTAYAAGTACNDGNACTYNDVCNGSGGCGGTPITCSSTACATKACNGTSQCSVTYLANTTKCRDPSGPCDVAAYCTGSAETCPNAFKPNGTPCNDGNACTVGEQCIGGVCGTPSSTVVCGLADQCHTGAGTCDPGTGLCSYANKPNGTPCDDGVTCTSGESCQSGLCGSPTASACSYPAITYAYDQIGNMKSQTPGACQPATCSAVGAICGTASDGCGGSLSCGACPTGQVCLSNNTCCQPTTCAAQGKTCGTISDGCGGTLSCGSCGANQACGGNNVCVCASGYGDCAGNGTCVSLNTTANCGSCGNACPSFSVTHGVCQSGSCVQVCTAPFHDCGDGRCRNTGCP